MDVLKSKLEISRLPISKMLKMEVPELAEEVIGVVEKHDSELMQIQPVFELLVNKRSVIDSLKSPYGVDPVRLEQRMLRENMILHASAIKLRLRMLNKTEDVKDLHVIQTAVNRHLLYLDKSKNRKVLNQKISGFVDDVASDAEFAEAMEEYGFLPDVAQLKMALMEVRRISSKRSKNLSKRSSISTNQRMKIVYDAIEYVFKEIEVAQLRNPDVDYAPLIKELNVVVYKYRQVINRRDATNKRKAAEQNGELVDDDNSENGETPMAGEDDSTEVETETTVNGDFDTYHTSKVYEASIEKMENSSNGQTSTIESDVDSKESVDKEKAVDSSLGTSQQPFSTDKA